jgi:hypothetical protein
VPAHHRLIVTVHDRLRSLDQIGVQILAALGLPDDEPKHL